VIAKAPVTVVTHVLNAVTGADVTGTNLPPGSQVKDQATISWSGSLIPSGSVTYYFFTNGTCTAPSTSQQTVLVNATNGSVPPTSVQTLPAGMYSYLAVYSGDTQFKSQTGSCEPFMVGNPALTPGYWKNHLSISSALISGNQPFYLGYYLMAGTNAQIGAEITAVFNNMNCSNSSAQNAIGCLAGQLLAARLNVLNSAPLSITSTIATAQSFLGLGGTVHTVTYNGITTVGVLYTGPTASFKLTANQRSVAVALADALSAYNASGV
jgi:hypothetical protein